MQRYNNPFIYAILFSKIEGFIIINQKKYLVIFRTRFILFNLHYFLIVGIKAKRRGNLLLLTC